MKSFVALFFAFQACATVSSFPESLRGSRIIGGRAAKVGEFPWQVSLQTMNEKGDRGHRCGGTIIDNRHVLTAGHCLAWITTTKQLRVVAGELNNNDTEDPSRRDILVEALYQHENYSIDVQIRDDVGLVRVQGEIPFSSVIQPIPRRNVSLTTQVMCTTSGWGTLGLELGSTEMLQALDLPLVDQDTCVASYEDFESKVLPGMFCAGFVGGGPNPCSGDSGGGLICEGQVTGITSWNRACWYEAGLPVFTDVAYYQDWINKKIALSSDEWEIHT